MEDFSDEFVLNNDSGEVNTTRWNTSVASWSPSWSWDPANVKIVPNAAVAEPNAVVAKPNAVVANCSRLSAFDCFAHTNCRVCQHPPTHPAVCVDPATAASLKREGYTCVERPANDGFVDGMAAITMTHDPHQRGGVTVPYKSAILKSRVPGGIAYGRFEARIRGAQVWPGVCPAFWAWRHAGGYWTELDFVEMTEAIHNVKDIDFTSHVFPPTPGVAKHISNSTHRIFPFDPRAAFHTYAMEWNRTDLTWWVDGEVVKRLPAAPHFDQGWPMDVALSFGVRPPLRTSPTAKGFPTTFHVDWVRTWQRHSH